MSRSGTLYDLNRTPDVPPRRGRSRLKTRFPAKVILLSGTYSAELLDISLTGARLALSSRRTDAELEIGETIILCWDKFEKLGHIVWAKGDSAGMVFEELVTPSELIATRDLQDGFAQSGGYERNKRAAAQAWAQGYRV